MNQPGVPGATLQRAALTLHGLSERDRTWLLTALAPAQRERLAPLLAELEALGIPREPDLLSQVQDTAVCSVASWPEQMDAREIDALADVLALEPVALTHAVLAMQPWAWTTRFLAALDASRRVEMEAVRATPAPAPRLQEAILQALRAQLQVERPAAAAPGERAGSFARAGWTTLWRRA